MATKKDEVVEVVEVVDAAPPMAVEQNPMVLIADAVKQGQSADVMERLFNLNERFDDKQAKLAFDAALSRFQGQCPRIKKVRVIKTKSGNIPFAAYEDLMKVAQDVLTANGLSVSFDTNTSKPGEITVFCHVSGFGHTRTNQITMPAPDLRANETQKMGAANSYAKRYALQNALNIVVMGEDVDASILTGIIPDDGKPIEYMTEEQIFKLDVMLDALDDNKKGTRKRFEGFLKNLAGVDSIPACPARFHDQVESKLKEKMKEGGLG